MIYLTKKSGKFDTRSVEALKNLPDGDYILEKKTKKRSTEQNNYYWGVVIPILSEHFGYEHREMHEILKYKFLGFTRKPVNGENIPILNSTTKLTTTEFMAMIEEIQRWAAGFDIIIPDPNQTEFLDET